MNDDDLQHDETESVGGTMIRLNFREWVLAPEFEHLKDAPMGEFETCNELFPMAKAISSTRKITVAQYEKMIQSGVLTDADKVELLEGWIVQKTPCTPPQCAAIQRLSKRLLGMVPPGCEVRVQSAIRLADSQPEPDVALAHGDGLTFSHRHPEPTELEALVEVSDSTLARDRDDKGRIHARARIRVYWIVNLVDRQIEVYTQPSGPAASPSYSQRVDYRLGDVVPVTLNGVTVGTIPAAEILA